MDHYIGAKPIVPVAFKYARDYGMSEARCACNRHLSLMSSMRAAKLVAIFRLFRLCRDHEQIVREQAPFKQTERK